jgi:hypothetical protein
MGGTDMAEVTSAKLFDLAPKSGKGDYYSITVGIKPAYPVEDEIWQGFRIDFTEKGEPFAIDVEEVNKP